MVLSPIEISIIKRLHRDNKLPLRVYVVIPMNLLDNMAGLNSRTDFKDNVVKMGGVEILADGYLAARTAALLQPYSDDPATSGTLLATQKEMNASAAKILSAGFQPVIHAMGDKAVDAALTLIEQTSKKVPQKDVRYRIEQASVLNKELLERMKKQKVTVSVQPRVIASEFSVWSALEHLGPKRARWLYPLKTLLKEGIKVIGGSDCPMEPLSPLLGIQSAVTRDYILEERITVDEALRIYTVDAAYASFEENIKGSIETGKLADLTIISRDLHESPPNEIGNIEVDMTIVGGKVVYAK
jgi:predicted amidohydrolase YtcJ